MLRSIVSLLLLANINSAGEIPLSEKEAIEFDPQILMDLGTLPHLKEDYLAPDIKAKAAILVDDKTGVILYEKNSHERLPMASLTKIMTAILILENHGLDEIVEVKGDYQSLEGVKIGLHQNEEMDVGSLMKALLIRSAGDAAMALAEHHSGTVEDFVAQMNIRAQELNLTDTHFQNPVGLDGENHYSSAHDLSILARYAMRIPVFRQTVSLSQASVSSTDGRFNYNFSTTNYLLNSYLNILGVKTGTTDAAGESVINMARSDDGHDVLSVVLSSPSRFQESKSMLDWVFRSHLW